MSSWRRNHAHDVALYGRAREQLGKIRWRDGGLTKIARSHSAASSHLFRLKSGKWEQDMVILGITRRFSNGMLSYSLTLPASAIEQSKR